MIRKIWRALIAIHNRDRIPRVPRMYATHYDHLTIQQRRVLARMGARDPRGIAIAMRKHRATSIDDLIERLDHHRPRRRVWHRVRLALGRMIGGGKHPHAAEARRLMRQAQATDIKSRLKRWRA